MSRRVLRRESLRAWLRVQVYLRGSPQGFEYGFKRVFKCVDTRNEKAASEFWEISPESTTASVRGCACRWSIPVLPWISQMQVPTMLCSHTTSSCKGGSQDETARSVACGEMRFEDQGLGSKRDSASSTWCKTRMPIGMDSSGGA